MKNNWMWEIMEECKKKVESYPKWLIDSLRDAPRMYPSIRKKEEINERD